MLSVSVKVKRRGDAGAWLAGFEKRTKGPHAVKAGFPAGSPVDIVQIAIWNHFGTAGRTPRRGGWGGPIPSRPFITVAVFRHRREIRAMLRRLYQDIIEGRTTAEHGLRLVGQYGVSIIQETIARGLPPANSELTIKLKGSGKNTLNNEGRMRGSVGWAYDGSGQVGKGGRSGAYRAGQTAGRAFGRALARWAR